MQRNCSLVVYLMPAFLSIVTSTMLPRIADVPTDASLVRSLDARADDVPPILDFDYSTWIWTGETGAHLGVRLFRKKKPYSHTKYPVCAAILISSSDICVEIGAGVGSENPAVYTVALDPEGDNVFAIAVNIGQAPSLFATIVVDYKDDTSRTIVIDSTWKSLEDAPSSTTSWLDLRG